MATLGRLLGNAKIFLLTLTVVVSFIFSSIGWRHVDSSESSRIIVAAIILVGMYLLIVFELVNRNLAALIGAAASVAAYDCLVKFSSMEELLGWLDLETLSLLFGMMIIVNVLSGSGLFDFLAIWSYKQSGGRFWLLISIMSIITALLSALVDNVSTMLLLAPTLVKLSEFEHIDPRYVLMIMVIVCNVGGCATPVGDPPNLIIIGDDIVNSIDINFGSFTCYCAPGVVLTMAVVLLYLRLRYKSKDSFRLADYRPDDDDGLADGDGGDDGGAYNKDPEAPPPTESRQRPRKENLIEELQAIDMFEQKLEGLKLISQDTREIRFRLEERASELRHAIGDFERAELAANQLTLEGAANSGGGDSRRVSRLDEQQIQRLMRTHCITDHVTLYQSLAVLFVAIMLFFVQSLPGLQLTLGWVSLFAGLTLLVLSSRKGDEQFEHVIGKIEWSTLMFFFALFIVMEAMTKLGLIGFLGRQVTALIDQLPEGQARAIGGITIVLWASGLASACIDNVPFTSMMVKILGATIEQAARDSSASASAAELSALRALVFALSFGACFGGNGSLIGASANLVTAGISNRLGYPITFNGFFKFAAPITLLTLLVANLYLVVVFVWLAL